MGCKAPLLLLSGGSLWTRPTEAEQMRGVLSEWGVPDGAMILEDESRNTRENAVASLRLMQQRGLRRALLVTSAFHMPRALAIFQKEAARLSAQAAGPVASGEERGVAAQQQGAGALTIIPFIGTFVGLAITAVVIVLDWPGAGVAGAALVARQLVAFGKPTPTCAGPTDPNAEVRGLERLLRRFCGEDITFDLSLAAGVHPIPVGAGALAHRIYRRTRPARPCPPRRSMATAT